VQLDSVIGGDVDSLFIAPPAMVDLLDGDRVTCVPVEQANGKWAAEDLVLIERRRRLLAGVLTDNRGRLVLRPDPGLANRDWTVPDLPREARAGLALVASVASVDGEGRRCGEIVAGPVPTASWEWLRLLNAVRHLGVIDRDDPQRAAAADDALVADLSSVRSAADGGAEEAPPGPDPLDRLRIDRATQPCFTIDGASTRDLDDAIWAETQADGTTRVEVHIADAASTVTAGTALDRRALTRATTVYLASGPAPMLPRALSEGALSLRPGRDRRTISVSFVVDDAGAVTDVRVEATTVRSAARLTYAMVEDRLAGAAALEEGAVGGFEVTPTAEVPDAVWAALTAASVAAERIGAARLARGAMGTDLFVEPEARPIVNGDRVTLQRTTSTPVASHLIERLMVAANEAVARWLEERGAPALYRVQAAPDPERLAQLAALLATVGLPVDVEAVVDPSVAESLIDTAVEAGLERSVVAGFLAQGLSRAGYHPDPGTHFGLSSASYVHFTSPIRRAADLLVHRAVHGVLLGGGGPTVEELTAVAPWLDHRSGAASKAERGELRMLWADILGRTVAGGRPYRTSALIGAVRRGGLRVRVDRFDLVGIIPKEVLAPGNPESYVQAPDEMSATVGSVTYRVGDRIRVAIAEADRNTGDLTFEVC